MNTFPFIHLNIFHAVMNILALTPLMERFEAEYGTLNCLALFFGREYPICEHYGVTRLTNNSINNHSRVSVHRFGEIRFR